MKDFAKLALSASSTSGTSGLGYGCMGITAFYGDALPDDQAMELLKGVYDAGCRHFDTAEVYAAGDNFNEGVLGKFFQTVPRDSFSIATKFWPADGKYDYDTVKPHLVASLKRLQMDYVDLYYAHRVMSLEGGLEFARTAKRLLEEGLIKAVGLSEVSGAWLKQIHAICPIAAVQQEWSLMCRSLESELVPVCHELDVDVVAYSPLSRNLLATKVETAPTDFRAMLPRYSKDNLAKNNQIVDKIQAIATKYDCTAAQLSLAWLFHKAEEMKVTVIPIPGSTKIKNVLSNAKSVGIKISDEDQKELETLADLVAGQRYAEEHMQATIEAQQK